MHEVAIGPETCVRSDAGKVTCWKNIDADKPFETTTPIQQDAVELALGGYPTCARLSDGHVTCWGSNQYGALGRGHDEESREPANVVGLDDGTYVEIQGTAEATPFGRKVLDRMLELADAGMSRLFKEQRAALGEAASDLLR